MASCCRHLWQTSFSFGQGVPNSCTIRHWTFDASFITGVASQGKMRRMDKNSLSPHQTIAVQSTTYHLPNIARQLALNFLHSNVNYMKLISIFREEFKAKQKKKMTTADAFWHAKTLIGVHTEGGGRRIQNTSAWQILPGYSQTTRNETSETLCRREKSGRD